MTTRPTSATILISAFLLLALLGADSPIGSVSAILIGTVVCCAAAMSGGNIQDLEAGHLVGATPYKQQLVQGVGVVSAAFVIAPTHSNVMKIRAGILACSPGGGTRIGISDQERPVYGAPLSNDRPIAPESSGSAAFMNPHNRETVSVPTAV